MRFSRNGSDMKSARRTPSTPGTSQNDKNKKIMKRNILYSGIVAIVITSFSSCALYKGYERPTDLKTEQLYGNSLAENSEETMAQLSWRELYTDPLLQALIEKALENNTGLKAQQWAVEQAKASHTASKLAYLPSLYFSPSGGYSTPDKTWSYQLPFALNWEIDIFGGIHNQRKMAKAALASQQDLEQAVHSRLIATVASCYYQLMALDQTMNIIIDANRVWNELIKSSEELMANGEINGMAVTQFKGQSYDFQANQRTVEHSIKQVELELCSILGEAPHAIERGNLLAATTPAILQTGLSSQLLANRPDVRQAERNLEYFYHNNCYARSNFFPKFVIDASAVFSGSWITSFIGGLTQPIFARGKIIAEKRAAKAQYEQAKLNYQQKLIDASADVVKAMSQWSTSHNNYQTRLLQVEEYQKAVDYSKTLMFNGECTYLDVLTAQTNLFSKSKSLVDDRLEELIGIVNLYLALGGGCE